MSSVKNIFLILFVLFGLTDILLSAEPDHNSVIESIDNLILCGEISEPLQKIKELQNEDTLPANFKPYLIIREAVVSSKRGDNVLAASLFRRAQSLLSPGETNASDILLSHQAQLYHKGGDYAASAVAYKNAATHSQTSIAATNLFMAADSYERMSEYKSAYILYTNALSYATTPFSKTIKTRLAAMLDRIGRTDKSLEIYRELNSSYPGDKTISLFFARAYAKLYDNEKVIEELIDFGEDETGEATLLLAQAYYGVGKITKALDISSSFLMTVSSNSASLTQTFIPDIYYWRGAIAFNSEDYTRAREFFFALYSLYPSHPLCPMAILYSSASSFILGHYKKAAREITLLIRNYPDSKLVPTARLLQAKALSNSAEFEDAVLVLDELIERFPETPYVQEAAILRGDILRISSALSPTYLTDAITSYKVAVTKENGSKNLSQVAINGIIRCLIDLGKTDEIELWQKMIEKSVATQTDNQITHSTKEQP